MPCRHVELRRKLRPARVLAGVGLAAASASEEEEQDPHHTGHEFCMGFASLCFNLMFSVGSICFFSGDRAVLEVGDWLFIVGSLGVFLMAGWHTLESLAERRSKGLDEHQRDEVLENLHFCISSLIFAAGSVLFMPGLYGSDTAEFWGHEWGAWLFAAGSFGFLSAGYWNALGLNAKRGGEKETDDTIIQAESRCSNIASVELWVLLVASALFVVGSFLYRPSLETQCPQAVRRAAQEQLSVPPGRSLLQSGKFLGRHSTLQAVALQGGAEPVVMPMCVSPAMQGTYLYTIGSFMFVGESLMCLARTRILHSAHAAASAKS